MNDESAGSILRRMIALASDAEKSAEDGVDPAAATAFGTVLARLAQDRFDMVLAPQDVSTRVANLPELMEILPETGMLALLDGPGEAQGILALDAPFFSALVEQQTMGRLKSVPPPNRQPTRVDAALVADIIDSLLSNFALTDEGRFVIGYGYTTFLAESRPLALMLEETDYSVLAFGADMDRGTRTGSGFLALPRDGALGEGAGRGASAGLPDAAWEDALRANLSEAETTVDAVLHRIPMPIADVTKLKAGDTLHLPVSALSRVRLEGAGGGAIGLAELGQTDGMRAVRLMVNDRKPSADTGPFESSAPDAGAMLLEETPGSPPALDMELVSASDLPELPDIPGLAGDSGGDGLPELPGVNLDADLPSLDDLGGGEEGGGQGLPSLDDLPDLPDLGDLPALGDDGGLPDLPPLGG